MNKRHGARDPCVSAPRGCGEALLCSTGAEAKYKNLNLELVRKVLVGSGPLLRVRSLHAINNQKSGI